ncbi:MAG: ATP-dependent 6-phosphofructokinase [bacterium]
MNCDIKNLGVCKIPSPLIVKLSNAQTPFVSDSEKIMYNVLFDQTDKKNKNVQPSGFEKAGLRKKIYFDPSKVRSAIVTCGGLCPGLNDVIRAIVMESHYRYGARTIYGIRFGYNGLNPEKKYEPLELNPILVRDIHKTGGTILGSSRGGAQDKEALVDSLERLNINILYAIGGDGTLKGAHDIAQIAIKRRLKMSVIGIPKTIDNDISYIQRTFGFETAFSKAVDSIYSAHVEAEGAPNGIGLVKLMGRHSGYIAANAALAQNDVNFVLIPEVKFDMQGENGFLKHLERRLDARQHAVVCVAEGAGQEILLKYKSKSAHDASGNIKLADIGLYLKDEIGKYFKSIGKEVNLKYIDPSYIIRSAPANPNDSIFCALLGQFAVHAGMAGKTDMIIGVWNNIFSHVPISLVTSRRTQIDPDSIFWYNVLEATGQPADMTN